jgi:hypothetical protein
MRPQTGDADDDELERDDVAQQVRPDEDEYAADEGDERLYQGEVDGHHAKLRLRMKVTSKIGYFTQEKVAKISPVWLVPWATALRP